MTVAEPVFKGVGAGGRRRDPRVLAAVKAIQGQDLFRQEDDIVPLWEKAAVIVEIIVNVERSMERRKNERL